MLVVQPRHRGTGRSYAVCTVSCREDCSQSNGGHISVASLCRRRFGLYANVDLAFEGVRARLDLLVLLAASPDCPEHDYCWIELGERVNEYLQMFRIRAFWKNPSHSLSVRLWQAGCLWNTSLLVARMPVLLGLMRKVFPQLAASFADVRAIIGTENETSVVEKIYGRIAVRDFLHEVSIKHAENIAVLPVSGIEWADLEKPHEVSTASSLC